MMQIINEAVNLEQNWIFVAIPKTGTTSIREQTRQNGTPLIPNPHLNILQIKDAIVLFYLREALRKNFSFPTVDQKNYSDIKTQALSFFENAFKFASVRNPWERAVSLFFRQEGVKEQQNKSFENFIENHYYASDTCVHPTLHKNQLDWIRDEHDKIIVDYVFKLENFDTAVKEIFEQTRGVLNLHVQVANKNKSSRSDQYREMYTDKTRRIINNRFEKDIDYFKFTF